MLDLSLLPTAPTSLYQPPVENTPIVHSRRTAVLAYSSPLVDSIMRMASVPWVILGWKQEAEQLHVLMVEDVKFARASSNLPKALRLEIHTHEKMMIYQARVEFVARFKGIRCVMTVVKSRLVSIMAER